MVTALIPIAQSMGVPRIVEGNTVPCVMGDPSGVGYADLEQRRRIMDYALLALTTQIEEPTVFNGVTAID